MGISKYDDIIDSRDVEERIEELQDEENLDNDEQQELDALIALRDEAKDYSCDWQYGEQLIRDTYFKDYCIELASDLSENAHQEHWPYTCIDWDQAARELQFDYNIVEFDGVDYWIRST